MKYIYAGDREISVKILKFLIQQKTKPEALILPKKENASHSKELIKICNFINKDKIFQGPNFKEKNFLETIREINPEYIFSIHLPYILPKKFLDIPKYGVLNLHPALLPYNRGFHTPTWAIYDKTPYGATLHFMNEEIDKGDIIHQRTLKIRPDDTADTLYNRVLELEIKVFKEAWPLLSSYKYKRKKQPKNKGTFHSKTDLKSIQKIQFNKKIKAGNLLNQIRALTTNNINEAAYFKIENDKYRVQIKIHKEETKGKNAK